MDNYKLSPDGSVVYRLMPEGTISASSLNTSLLNSGFTSTIGNDGVLSVSSYNAGFDTNGGLGGAQIEAIYSNNTSLGPNQVLQWIQVITTNYPASGRTSPYLDNGADTARNPNAPSQPFYTLTIYNSAHGPNLPANQRFFYDYSQRSPASVSATNSVNWSANLYPVIWNTTTNALTIENGVSWGWTALDAMVGTTSGIFTAPEPNTAIVSGVGTSNFSWGNGQPSSLSFSGGGVAATPNTKFKLGTLTYFNGTNTSGADAVEFDAKVNLTNLPEVSPSFKEEFDIVNTPNTSDPIASADTVSLGNLGYAFHVEEGETASVDVYATLSTGLSPSPAGVVPIDSAISPNDTLGTNPSYSLQILDLENPSTGGFVTTLNINGTKAAQTVGDEGTISPFAGVSVADSSAGVTQTLTVALSAAANGMLSNLGGGTYDATTGVYTITGTIAAVDAAVDGLVFTPTAHQVPAGQTVTTHFTITDTDSDGARVTNTTASVVATAGEVILHGSSSQYIVADDTGSLYIQDTVAGRDGTQILPGVNEMVFTNGVGIFDPTGTGEDVSRLYYAALDRAPDVAGLEAWTADINGSNVSLSAVANAFAASPEFIHDYGSLSDAAFVNQLYQNVLGRPADPAGAQFWDGALASGVSRGAVLVGLAESPENDAKTLSTAGDQNNAEAYRLYQAALDRAPDAAGLTYWSSALANGAKPTQVAQGFINSPEFQKDYGALSASDFVSTLYENVLHRAADPTGLQYWTNALQTGTSEASVLVGFSDSLENRVQTASATHANWVFIPA